MIHYGNDLQAMQILNQCCLRLVILGIPISKQYLKKCFLKKYLKYIFKNVKNNGLNTLFPLKKPLF